MTKKMLSGKEVHEKLDLSYGVLDDEFEDNDDFDIDDDDAWWYDDLNYPYDEDEDELDFENDNVYYSDEEEV